MSSESGKFVKNMAWMAAFNVAPPLFSMVVMMAAARILIPLQMDDYQTAIAFSSLFMSVGDLGIGAVLVRYVARDASMLEKYYSTYFTIRLVLLVFLYIASIMFSIILYRGSLVYLIAFAGVGQVATQLGWCFIVCCQGMEKLEYVGISTVFKSIVFLITGWGFTVLFMDWGLVAAGVLSNFIGVIMLYRYFQSKMLVSSFRLSLDRDIARKLIVESIPFMANVLLVTVLLYADRVILSLTRYSEVAYYSLPLGIFYSLTFISSSYATVAYPFISRLLHTNSLTYVYEKSFKYLVGIMAPMSLGLCLLSDKIIYFLYGPNYGPSINVLRVLSIMLFFYSMAVVTSSMLQAQHKESVLYKAQGVCTVANIGMNLVLCSLFGALGAAIAGLVTLGLLDCGINVYLMRDNLHNIKFPETIKCTLCGCVAMAIVILLVPIGNVFACVLLGMIVYAIAFVLSGGVEKSDIAMAKSIVKDFTGPKAGGKSAV